MHPENQPTNRRCNVLLSAYACQPGLSSEPGVGWHTVTQLSRLHDVWVLTSAEHWGAIHEEIEANPLPNVQWLIVDVPHWLTFWKKGERGRRIHYYLWQIFAYFRARRQAAKIKFDVAHHVTYVSYWTPSFISLLPVSFVWGPVGGGESAPAHFYPTFSRRGRRFERIRNGVRWLAHTFDPFVRLTARRAKLGLATTRETAEKMHRLGTKDVRIMGESALPAEDIAVLNALRQTDTNAPFRAVSMGRLTDWKGFHIGVEAFARLLQQHPDSEYWILGDGDQAAHLQQLIDRHGIGEQVRLMGRVPREQALDILGACDVLLHPSLHDSGGWVCLEAMAAGKPVVCLNLGGPAVQVTDETGFRVAADSVEGAIAGIAEALAILADDPACRQQMGAAGRQLIAEKYRWEQRATSFDALYREVLEDT